MIEKPILAEDPRFATGLARVENCEQLDGLIEEWTSNRSDEEVMSLMQEAGVAAGAVLNGRDLGENVHLNARGFYKELVHPEIGHHRYLLPPFRLSKTPGEPRMAAPCLGQHNEYVCKRILGMNDEEFIRLLNEGIFD